MTRELWSDDWQGFFSVRATDDGPEWLFPFLLPVDVYIAVSPRSGLWVWDLATGELVLRGLPLSRRSGGFQYRLEQRHDDNISVRYPLTEYLIEKRLRVLSGFSFDSTEVCNDATK